MSIGTVYVNAPSKKAINEALGQGRAVRCETFGPWAAGWTLLEQAPDGTVVKIYSKRVGGSPYTKAYGTITRKLRLLDQPSSTRGDVS